MSASENNHTPQKSKKVISEVLRFLIGQLTHFCMNNTDNHKIQREQERDRENRKKTLYL